MRRPNILLISTDEHCGHAMSCAGNPNVTTPALDRLAGQGVRFNNAYVTKNRYAYPSALRCRWFTV